jgi:hypothetical protein
LMRIGSLPSNDSPISATAASTLRARPSTTGSPQPARPSSVWILRNIQRGATRQVVNPVIFIRRMERLAPWASAERYACGNPPILGTTLQAGKYLSQGNVLYVALPSQVADGLQRKGRTEVQIPPASLAGDAVGWMRGSQREFSTSDLSIRDTAWRAVTPGRDQTVADPVPPGHLKAAQASQTPQARRRQCDDNHPCELQHPNHLATHTYLAGDAFTLADLMSEFALVRMPAFGGRTLDDLPNVQRYTQRLVQRPAWQRAMTIAGPKAKRPGSVADHLI